MTIVSVSGHDRHELAAGHAHSDFWHEFSSK
jgi:hypothetical protein